MSDQGLVVPDSDLFGPDPGADPLAYYNPVNAGADLFASATQADAAMWRRYASGLSTQAEGNLAGFQAYLDRHVMELGLAFRMTGDEHERPWPLNPMPLIIGASEWAGIEAGLVQRAELLEAVIADIYGPGLLVQGGDLPASIVSGSDNFARRMMGIKPSGGHFLHVLAVDLARGPTGEWRVLGERVRLPVGIGYALENRNAMTRSIGGLLASIGTRRHSEFFDALRQGIARSCEREDPRIALLTPGRFNQSYPEQAHLARHLGFALVEGRDLVVQDGRLYVRTIAGLKRIDALWRWIGSTNIDPLNFDARSQIGVPNLISACEQGLVLANWPGSGVVESRAMGAFLPRLADRILGEPLILPNAATWWCGQKRERDHVMANLDSLAIGSAFRNEVPVLPDGVTRLGQTLSPAERADLERAMALRPMDYTAQEIVNLSTTPALVAGHFEPRGFTLRTFLARDGAGKWCLLPGGFARLLEGNELRPSLMSQGDVATDVCIVSDPKVEPAIVSSTMASPTIRREHGLLPSQAADNLFWTGRYMERAHLTGRVVRTMLGQISDAGTRSAPDTALNRLANLLRRWGAAPEESIGWSVTALAATALSDTDQGGSMAHLVGNARQIALLMRDRMTADSWRAMHRPLPRFPHQDEEAIGAGCDVAVEHFAAFGRLMSDGMNRNPAWRFFDIGSCLERGSMIVQIAAAMVPGSASAEDLAALLDIVDAQSVYRSRYLTMPFIAPVLDIVLLDPAQPTGLARQARRIESHLRALPQLTESGMPERPLRIARQLCADVEGCDAELLTMDAMERLRGRIGELSDAISERYFLQAERTEKSGGQLLS